ncbi:MAG: tubulin-tyrosine ligase [Tatlockia sp.]|nr:tubulin-tyrosine ligase [Tatlockia sp.]
MSHQLCFFLKASQSPTHYNLCRYLQEQNWLLTFHENADFSDENLQFDANTALQLEYKHLLTQLVSKNCPAVMPLSYCINDENWSRILAQLALTPNPSCWILKPSLLNNGQYIKIFQNLVDLNAHFLSSKRLGGEHVLQSYLRPHLLRDRRKYSIRMLVITTNYTGNYIYPHGYYNVALHPYDERNFSDLRSHLTNEHLQNDEANVLQIPTQRFTEFSAIYPQIKAIVTAVIKGLKVENPKAFQSNKKKTLAIFGFDFMVDSSGRLWLLEANHGPCFPLVDTHPLQRYLYADFWKSLIENFIRPLALDQPKNTFQNQSFELI